MDLIKFDSFELGSSEDRLSMPKLCQFTNVVTLNDLFDISGRLPAMKVSEEHSAYCLISQISIISNELK